MCAHTRQHKVWKLERSRANQLVLATVWKIALGEEGGQPENIPPTPNRSPERLQCFMETKIVDAKRQNAERNREIIHAHSMHSTLELFIRL